MKSIYYTTFMILTVLLSGCNSGEKKTTDSTNNDNEKFAKLSEQFIEALWKLNPGWASSQGYHKYDSVLVVNDEGHRKEEIAFCERFSDSLKKIDQKSLSPNNQTDYFLIENQLNSAKWYTTTFKSWEWNPSDYNISSQFDNILEGTYAPLDERMKNIGIKLLKVDAYYKAGMANIKNPTIVHTNLGIKQNKGAISVLESIEDSLTKCGLKSEEKDAIKKNIAAAKKSVNSYVDFLEKDVLPKLDEKTARSFRIGKDLFEAKFKYDIVSQYPAEEIYKRALQRKGEIQHEMMKLTRQLWNEQMGKEAMPVDSLQAVRKMIDKLSLKHVHRDSLLTAIKKQMPELTDFINKKNLIYLDPKKPLVVRETPVYQQGVAGAGIDAPGPYDKEANTYYNVTPLTNYTAEKAESYLREYNWYLMQILNIHEAIPGHYTQLIYSNQSPSLVKSILGNGAMVEGWAVYSERMMLEEGYGNNDPAMWLFYYKWHLRSVCNTILDYSIHTLNMSKEDALHLLIDEAFQQKAEAEEKYNRVSLTQVQLCSYFTGFTEIYDLRNEIRKKEGDKFNLKKFHEKFLSYGSAPVKYIRELMLKDETAGGEKK